MPLLLALGNHPRYSDWKNRGLLGKVKSIEQDFYKDIAFMDNQRVVDSTKLFMQHLLIFDAEGNLGHIIKKIKNKQGWKTLDYIYDYDSSGNPMGYTAVDEKGNEVDRSKFQWVTPYLLETNTTQPHFEYTIETIQFDDNFRSESTKRRHLIRDKLISEEIIEDSYNKNNEIMRTNYTNIHHINTKKSTTQSTSNTYKIYQRDTMKNWLEMSVMIGDDEANWYYTTRKLEYYK